MSAMKVTLRGNRPVELLSWSPAGGYGGLWASSAKVIAEILSSEFGGEGIYVREPGGIYAVDNPIAVVKVLETVLAMLEFPDEILERSGYPDEGPGNLDIVH